MNSGIKENLNKKNEKIPHIIHQVYEDIKGPSESLLELTKTWKEFHPNWAYRFWQKESIEDFINANFPYFISVYRNYPFNVQRWDAIRYLLLYHYGGLYVDIDYECLANFDLLLQNADCCMGLEPYHHALEHHRTLIVGNALMASTSAHRYFELIIEDMIKNKNTIFSEFYKLQILESTGPFLTTRVYNLYPDKKQIRLLPDELIAPLSIQEICFLLNENRPEEIDNKIDKAYAIHYFMGSWHTYSYN